MTSFICGVASAIVGMSAESALGNTPICQSGEQDTHMLQIDHHIGRFTSQDFYGILIG
jgi:hypothetical protein